MRPFAFFIKTVSLHQNKQYKMGRILAIDYGQKRVGIAVTDTLQMIANGLTTVATSDIMTFLEQYVAKEPVDLFVVGLPKQMNNQASESMKYIAPFVGRLKQKFPTIEVKYVDERFTSVLAHQTMLDGGLKKKDRQNKALVDQISATIILQSYLETRSL
jgi:putative Holliday junction resolvase